MFRKAAKRVVQYLLAALGFCAGCSPSSVLSPGEFTGELATAIKNASPGLDAVIVKDLELRITPRNGRESTAFLDSTYGIYKQNPKAKSEVIQRFIAATLDAVDFTQEAIDHTRIVPVIKDRPWLEETNQALMNRGVAGLPDLVYEDFSPELIVVYAEDSPNNIRYLGPKHLELAKIERRQLRVIACENLKRLLPKIERHGADGFYMLTAGGDYEASLLVLDSIWSGGQMDVDGEVVVAIPTRDLLLVTGSRNSQGIEKLKLMVKEAFGSGSYTLTQKLFVYRNGKFHEFEAEGEGAGNESQPIR